MSRKIPNTPRDISCTVTITETAEGKLAIFAKIPTGAEGTIGGQLAEKLVDAAAHLMNEVLGEKATVQRGTEQ